MFMAKKQPYRTDMPKNMEGLHLNFHKTPDFHKLDLPKNLPVLESQAETRSSIAKIFREVGDKAMSIAVATCMLGMLVLCLANTGFEWIQERFGSDES
jgi:hypothetical protein